MAVDAKAMRGELPVVFTNLKKGDGLDEVVDFIREALAVSSKTAS